MAHRVYVFYANRLYGECEDTYHKYRELVPVTDAELYNGGYVYTTRDQGWFRCDLTPVLDEDVPKELKLLLLLLL